MSLNSEAHCNNGALRHRRYQALHTHTHTLIVFGLFLWFVGNKRNTSARVVFRRLYNPSRVELIVFLSCCSIRLEIKICRLLGHIVVKIWLRLCLFFFLTWTLLWFVKTQGHMSQLINVSFGVKGLGHPPHVRSMGFNPYQPGHKFLLLNWLLYLWISSSNILYNVNTVALKLTTELD